jgi:hypothetical protein
MIAAEKAPIVKKANEQVIKAVGIIFERALSQ